MIVLSNNIVLGTVNEAATHSHLGIFPKTITITITITVKHFLQSSFLRS